VNTIGLFVVVEFYERNLFNVTMLNTYSSKNCPDRRRSREETPEVGKGGKEIHSVIPYM
jgi:hypothetical protein